MLVEPSLTVGIEEEYLLVDPETRNLMVDPPNSLWDEARNRLLLEVPNLPHESVPPGRSEG